MRPEARNILEHSHHIRQKKQPLCPLAQCALRFLTAGIHPTKISTEPISPSTQQGIFVSRHRFSVLLICMLFLQSPVVSAFIADAQVSLSAQTRISYSIKAAYIFNFAKFMKWPGGTFSQENQPFFIAIVGDDDCMSCFEALANKKIQGHPITLTQYTTVQDIPPTSCHILFVTGQYLSQKSRNWLKGLSKPILSIGESPAFLNADGMITFISHGDTIRFIINHQKIKNNHLTISSRLLKLAVQIYSSGENN